MKTKTWLRTTGTILAANENKDPEKLEILFSGMRFVKHPMTFSGNGRLAGLVAAVLLAPLAFAQTTQRPISDFLEAQGTFCIPNGSGGCLLFIPPVPNFVGWGDQAGDLAASVDYAGLANACSGNAFGTTMSGVITERALANGQAEDTVLLFTQNALTWVVGPLPNGMIDFVKSPVVFGHRWDTNSPTCTLNGASPALGTSFLHIKFTNTAPGAPLPDLIQLLFAPAPGQRLVEYTFQANATGPLANGTPGTVTVVQTGNMARTNIQAAVINLRATGK
jgi:hypothetical protein